MIKHQRRSIRLKGYDYAQAGAYFVTICTQGRVHLFGEIVDGVMRLNDVGRMVAQWYDELAKKFPDVECGEYTVMPNHFHGVVIIVGADLCVCPPPDNPRDMGKKGAHVGAPLRRRGADIPSVVQWFKTMTTNAYIRGVKQSGWSRFDKKLWQRNYWEHIVRNEQEFERIVRYIRNNPAQWQYDQLNEGAHAGAPLQGSPNEIHEPQSEYANEVWMV